MRIALVLLLLSTLCQAGEVRPAFGEADAPTEFPNVSLLIETPKLAELLTPPKNTTPAKFVIIDARPKDEFQAARIPGARSIESDPFQDANRPPTFLPAPENVAGVASRCGIDPDTLVIIYDNHGGRLAARLWFTFYAYGHDKLAILHGGYAKWRGEQRNIEAGVPPPVEKPGTWKPAETLRGVVSSAELPKFFVPAAEGAVPPTTIIDARDYAEYMGLDVRSKWGGHVPHAANYPWESSMRTADLGAKGAEKQEFLVWKEPSEIHALLRAACVVPKSPLVVYDQSGGRAAHLMFTLHLMGYTHTVCYYGGWREYGNLPSPEIEK